MAKLNCFSQNGILEVYVAWIISKLFTKSFSNEVPKAIKIFVSISLYTAYKNINTCYDYFVSNRQYIAVDIF